MPFRTLDTEPQPALSARRSGLLDALHAAQDQHGYLSEEAMSQVAQELDLPLKDVYSTATFYSMYHMKAAGQYAIQVCEGLSCHLAGGGQELVDHLERKLGIQVGQTTPDGRFSLETVQCLASCSTSPNLRINDRLYENVTPEEGAELLDRLAGR
jgi:NADH-quinone oxidoreductase subunit E